MPGNRNATEPRDMPGFIRDDMQLAGRKIPILRGEIPIGELKYFADNPRVYSLIRAEDDEPDQEEIEKRLQGMDHVKQLIQDIRSHGGLIEPLLVRDGSYDVLEGNSRLAAYRALAKKQPIQWAKARAILLPQAISDSQISALLSQLHLKGRKEWPPYEQAGHVYRRHRRDGLSIEEVSAETGITKGVLSTLVAAFALMLEHEDKTRERWSYYLELVKSRKIGKIRQEYPQFDDVVVECIQSGTILTAQDLRDKLPVICKASPRTIKKFIEGKLDFEDAFEEASAGGADNKCLQKLKTFRGWLADSGTQNSIKDADGKAHEKIVYEVRQIQKIVTALEKKLATR